MIRTAAVALLLCVANPAFAQASIPRIAALDWLTGTWVQQRGGERVVESWIGPSNGIMVAANLSTWPNGKWTYEFLRISETPAGFSYFASPGGREPVEFKVKESGERRVVFENPDHDFPQRIIYWREGDALIGRIEGSINGTLRSQQWRFEHSK